MKIRYLFGKLPPGMKISNGNKLRKSLKNINGFYSYDTGIVYVNLGTSLLQINQYEEYMIHSISQTLQHECLHKAIYEITNEDANKYEENIIYKITGER